MKFHENRDFAQLAHVSHRPNPCIAQQQMGITGIGTDKQLGNIFPLTQTRIKSQKHAHSNDMRGSCTPPAFLLYFTSHTVVYFPLLLPSVATFPHRHSQLSCFMSVLSFIFRRTMPPRASITGPAFFSWRWERAFHDTRAPAMANSWICV